MTQKRKFRELEEPTKSKISEALKGLTKSEKHKKAISDAMKAYWASVPNRPVEEQELNKSINPLNENEK